MAVIGATQLEPVNVLGSFVGGMEAGRTAAAQRQKEAEALRLQRQQEAVNALIGAGALETAEGRNALARMPGGFDVLKDYGESQEKLGKGMEAQTKGLSDRLQLWKRMLPADPVSAARWVQSAYADPIVGPELAKFGTREEVIAGIPSNPNDYMKWAEGVSMFADEYAKRRVPTAEAMLPYTQPKSPAVMAQDIEKARAGAARTSITNVQERAEAGEYGKFLQKSYEDIRERANRGRRFLPNLELASKTLERGLETGFGAEFKKDAQRVLVGLGLSTEEAKANVENAELFQTVVKNQVLQRLADQKGPQTDQDALRAEQTIAGFDKSTDVNKFLIAFDKAVTKQDIAQEKFYRDWRAKNKTFEGAEDAWFSGPGSKSVFDDPALKKFVGGESNVPPPPPGMQINR